MLRTGQRLTYRLEAARPSLPSYSSEQQFPMEVPGVGGALKCSGIYWVIILTRHHWNLVGRAKKTKTSPVRETVSSNKTSSRANFTCPKHSLICGNT